VCHCHYVKPHSDNGSLRERRSFFCVLCARAAVLPNADWLDLHNNARAAVGAKGLAWSPGCESHPGQVTPLAKSHPWPSHTPGQVTPPAKSHSWPMPGAHRGPSLPAGLCPLCRAQHDEEMQLTLGGPQGRAGDSWGAQGEPWVTVVLPLPSFCDASPVQWPRMRQRGRGCWRARGASCGTAAWGAAARIWLQHGAPSPAPWGALCRGCGCRRGRGTSGTPPGGRQELPAVARAGWGVGTTQRSVQCAASRESQRTRAEQRHSGGRSARCCGCGSGCAETQAPVRMGGGMRAGCAVQMSTGQGATAVGCASPANCRNGRIFA